MNSPQKRGFPEKVRVDSLAEVVVIPCFNEADRLDVEAVARLMGGEAGGSRLLFVDDGSTDGTAAVLEGLAARFPRKIQWFSLERNGGKGEAVRQGVLRAALDGPQYIGFWDADFSTPLEAIGDFMAILEARPDLEMVFGSRVQLLGREITRKPYRHYLGRVFATFASGVLDLAIYDTQCGAKLFRWTPEIQQLFEAPFLSPWLFDVEIVARLNRQRKEQAMARQAVSVIYELPLNRWRDEAGSKVGVTDFLRSALDLWRIHRAYRTHG